MLIEAPAWSEWMECARHSPASQALSVLRMAEEGEGAFPQPPPEEVLWGERLFGGTTAGGAGACGVSCGFGRSSVCWRRLGPAGHQSSASPVWGCGCWGTAQLLSLGGGR